METLTDSRFNYFVIAVILSSQVNHQLSQDSLEDFLLYRESDTKKTDFTCCHGKAEKIRLAYDRLEFQSQSILSRL